MQPIFYFACYFIEDIVSGVLTRIYIAVPLHFLSFLQKDFRLGIPNEVYRKSAIGHLEKLTFSDFFKTRHSIFKKNIFKSA